MARRRGTFGTIILGIFLCLAFFGAYTLYMNNEKDVDDAMHKASDKASAVHRALKKE